MCRQCANTITAFCGLPFEDDILFFISFCLYLFFIVNFPLLFVNLYSTRLNFDFRMVSTPSPKTKVYLLEQRKNQELNIEHIDEEMRLEQVRQAASKMEWTSFGQAVRRNLLVTIFFKLIYCERQFEKCMNCRKNVTQSMLMVELTCSTGLRTWKQKCQSRKTIWWRRRYGLWLRVLGKFSVREMALNLENCHKNLAFLEPRI